MVELDFLTLFKKWAYVKTDEEDMFYEQIEELTYNNGEINFNL